MKKTDLALMMAVAMLAGMPSARGFSDIAAQLDAITQKAAFEIGIQVNLAGKQRMLTQKMSKDAVLIALGIDAEQNRQDLKDTIALFDKTLKGLKNGDPSLNLAATTHQKILDQLQKVEARWSRFRPLVEQIVKGAADKSVIEKIATDNLALLKEMDKAVSLYAGISGAEEAELAVVINLSGRQRMLTQEMTKEYLLMAYGVQVETNRKRLARSVSLFDRTLNGLLEGDGELGLPATKDEKIRKQLMLVKSLWLAFAPVLQKPANEASLKQVAKGNLPLLKEMDKAVKMYEQSW